METTPFLLHQLATEQQPIGKPSAGIKSITSSSRKKRCGQYVGCRIPDSGKRLFRTNKEKTGVWEDCINDAFFIESAQKGSPTGTVYLLHPHNHSPVQQNLPKPINHMCTKQTAKWLSSSQQYTVTGHSTTTIQRTVQPNWSASESGRLNSLSYSNFIFRCTENVISLRCFWHKMH